MNFSREKRNRPLGLYPIGLPLLLLIYIILCVITLSVLSLLTSRGNMYNERDEVKSKEALNQAENQAEEWIHEMKNKDVNSRVKEETKDFMVKENSYLHVTLSLNEETSQYEITSYVLVDSSPDTDDETLQGL
ncbi:MAG: hypothetical protein II044_00055 [Lachnospiraceae bacterium]|nr:hypothetical protein [Lachnospiraceae bacterium]MEE3356568.1 hypothetical protein [Lachnospiraceae bacterium]